MRNATDAERWRALFESDDRAQARVVATCLAAMEFDVRLDADDPLAERFIDPDQHDRGRFVVEVAAADWAELAEVLEEILSEQARFDEFLADAAGRSNRSHRRLLITMIVIVSALGVAGVIDL